MAYLDPSPDGLMPAPLVATSAPEAPATVAPAVAPARAPINRMWLEKIALSAIILFFAGLTFTLAVITIGNLGIALIVTALALLPLASLMTSPSGNGRQPVRRRTDGAWS